MSTTGSSEATAVLTEVINSTDKKTKLEIPFIVSNNEDSMVSAVIAKMALQIFGWKDLTVPTAYPLAVDSLKQAEEFFKALESHGYVKRKNGKIEWQKK